MGFEIIGKGGFGVVYRGIWKKPIAAFKGWRKDFITQSREPERRSQCVCSSVCRVFYVIK